MDISDVLTVLSIAIAVLSISYASDRKIWLYKFTKWDRRICILWFLTANYFIFFDFFYANGWYFPQLMRTEGLYFRPKTWAYLITIITTAYFMHKIYANRFPKSRYEALTNYYLTLINTNFYLLSNYLNEFHKKDIQKHIELFNKRIKEEEYENNDEPDFDESNEGNITHKDNESYPLAGLIISRIIFNKNFITESIGRQPLLFLELIHNLQSNIFNSQTCIEFYYRHLIQERNSYLTEGLNRIENFISTGDFSDTVYQLTDSNLAQLTFGNLAFTCRMEIWKAFKDEGLKDAETNKFFSLKTDEWKDTRYYTTPARICLKFYDILIRELICHWYKTPKDKSERIDLHYLYLISKGVWIDFQSMSDNYYAEKTYAEKFFDDTLSYMYAWLSCMKKHNRPQHQDDILQIVTLIIILDDYPDELRFEAAKWLLNTFLNLTLGMDIKDNLVSLFQSKIIEVQRKDRNNYLLIGWDCLDHAKYSSYPLYEHLKRLIH